MEIGKIDVGDEVKFFWHKLIVQGTVYKKGKKYLNICFRWNGRWRKTRFKPNDYAKHLSKTGNKREIDSSFVYWIEKEAFTGR